MAAAPTTAAIASAAGAPIARVSVATLMTTNIRTDASTSSTTTARPAEMLGTVAPRLAVLAGQTSQSARAAAIAPAAWAAR
jgi:predicted MarR family transcription regulator